MRPRISGHRKINLSLLGNQEVLEFQARIELIDVLKVGLERHRAVLVFVFDVCLRERTKDKLVDELVEQEVMQLSNFSVPLLHNYFLAIRSTRLNRVDSARDNVKALVRQVNDVRVEHLNVAKLVVFQFTRIEESGVAHSFLRVRPMQSLSQQGRV